MMGRALALGILMALQGATAQAMDLAERVLCQVEINYDCSSGSCQLGSGPTELDLSFSESKGRMCRDGDCADGKLLSLQARGEADQEAYVVFSLGSVADRQTFVSGIINHRSHILNGAWNGAAFMATCRPEKPD